MVLEVVLENEDQVVSANIWHCSTNGGTNWKYPLVFGVVCGAAGTALGAGFGWLNYK